MLFFKNTALLLNSWEGIATINEAKVYFIFFLINGACKSYFQKEQRSYGILESVYTKESSLWKLGAINGCFLLFD